jgi:hypothetical protein
MPDMLAHHEVAEGARARLAEGPLARLLAAEHDAFKVGAQGPDFLFYSGVWPGRKSRADLAASAHRHRTGATIGALLAYAAGAPARERAVTAAFACGYAAHLCLDASAHPWIQYWTGDVERTGDPAATAAARRRHGVFEASIDVWLSRRHSADQGWVRRQRLLVMAPEQVAAVTAAWEHAEREVYGATITAAEGRAAFRDMAFIYGNMSDRRTAFSRTVLALGPLIDPDGTNRAIIYPRDPHPTAAALLGRRRTWYNPWEPESPRDDTFDEIMEAASAQALAILQATERAFFGDGDAAATLTAEAASGPDPAGIAAAVAAAAGDRSMLTGLPCEDPRPAVAFVPGMVRLWGLS